MTSLPELDMSAFRAAPQSAAGRTFVAALRDACHGPGYAGPEELALASPDRRSTRAPLM